MSNPALVAAIQAVGTQVVLAEKLREITGNQRFRQGHISKWLLRCKGPVPPAEYVLAIEQATGGKVSRHQLRPDLYPLADAA